MGYASCSASMLGVSILVLSCPRPALSASVPLQICFLLACAPCPTPLRQRTNCQHLQIPLQPAGLHALGCSALDASVLTVSAFFLPCPCLFNWVLQPARSSATFLACTKYSNACCTAGAGLQTPCVQSHTLEGPQPATCPCMVPLLQPAAAWWQLDHHLQALCTRPQPSAGLLPCLQLCGAASTAPCPACRDRLGPTPLPAPLPAALPAPVPAP